MEIKSLEGVPFNLIYNAFSSAFEEYEVQLNKQQLIKMLKRRGFDPGLSFAFFDNCDMVAFILNGIGNFGGIATAYDTGTGTLKEYRGKGLATELFNYSIPFLRQRNIRQYLLE
ncbi:MAG: GNAT family N-acetyltransferase, partial [Bacteroidales bacterium]|nr:GNAT family N-acetyltransferase [Bacteroidales bacterium]